MQVIPNTHVFQNNRPTEEPVKITPAMLRKAAETIQKTAIRIILDKPFFASLMLRMGDNNQVGKPDDKVKTMITDGKNLRYNPAWVTQQKTETIEFSILSEVMHCVLHHNTRRNGRDSKTWERSCDLKVNQVLEESGVTLPPDAPRDKSYDDMSAEEVYRKLYIEPPDEPQGGGGNGPGEQPQGGGSNNSPGEGDGQGDDQSDPPQPQDGSGGYGDVEDSPAESPAEIAQEEAEQDIATQTAAQNAKAQGKLPGSLQKLIKEMLEPKVDWREELREFVQAYLGKDDQTWNKVNRRFVGGGQYLPGYQSETLPPIIVAIDTSGSVSDNELAQFNGELNKIMEDFPETKMTAVYCDTRITDVIDYSSEVPFGSVKPNIARGGTRFEPPFEFAAQRDEPPAALIYLTDGEAGWPKEPDFPTLWIITNKHINAPWGRTVPMEI